MVQAAVEQDEWRPVVSAWLLGSVKLFLIGLGAYWWYLNRHSGDLVVRAQAVGLVLSGLWAHHFVRVRPAPPRIGTSL